MTNLNKIHLAIISMINLTFIAKMINIAWEGNDKAILLLIFGYPTLIILNAIALLALRLFKRPEYKIYQITTLGLIALLIPTVIIASLY